MTQVTIAVPTFAGQQEQFDVEIDAEWPDGSPIEGEVTALVAGRPDDYDDAVLGFIVGGGGSTAIPAKENPELVEKVQGAMLSHSMNLPPQE